MAMLPLPLRPTNIGGRARITLKTGLPPGATPYFFFLDFDKTITTEDSLDLLAQVAATMHSNLGQKESVWNAWEACKDAYLRDYEEFNKNYHTSKMGRVTLKQEIEYQRALRQVELKSTLRVSASEIFKFPERMTFNMDWYHAGSTALQKGSIKLRPGFVDFIDALEARNVNEMIEDHSLWGVISVNFCQQFVQGVVEAALPRYENWNRVNVLSNKLTEEGYIVAPSCSLCGEETRLLSCNDKVKAMQEILSWEQSKQVMTIYVGDSLTDLECLTEADVGICVYTNGGGPLKEAFDRMGYSIMHISSYNERDKQKWYWANDFTDITESRLMRPWIPLSHTQATSNQSESAIDMDKILSDSKNLQTIQRQPSDDASGSKQNVNNLSG